MTYLDVKDGRHALSFPLRRSHIYDPMAGGDKLDPALNKIDELILDYASTHKEDAQKVEDDLRAAFDMTGGGNNPPIVRFLSWIASQVGEGAPLSGGPAGGELSRAERMFGT